MKKIKIFHLTHCGTCKKILSEIDTSECTLQDIKESKIKASELDAMAKITGSYESLFSRKAIKYQSLGLKDQNLKEHDFRKWILEDYTFLKRPVVWGKKQVYAGHTKEAISGMKNLIEGHTAGDR
ncbi:MAG: hypothetical protein IPM34_08020 [Saprospiraceae bacterium]|nr:hypothetical protein [Saprospiraceae bacterium]